MKNKILTLLLGVCLLSGCQSSSLEADSSISSANSSSEDSSETIQSDQTAETVLEETDEKGKDSSNNEKDSSGTSDETEIMAQLEDEFSQTHSFTDDLGRTIEIDSSKRTASLIGSYTDMWVDAGGKSSLAASAHDTWTSFDLDLPDSVKDLGEIKNPNTEILVSVQPDLIIGSAKNESNKDLENLVNNSMSDSNIAYFDVSDFDDYLRVYKIFCDLNNNPEAYVQCGLKQQEEIEDLISKAAQTDEKKKILYLRAAGSSVKAKNSQGTVLGEMLEDLNTENVADSSTNLDLELSMEAILEADPDEIFLVYQGSDNSKAKKLMEDQFLSNPAWQSLRAVQNEKVHIMDQKLYNLKPNKNWARAYQELYEILYES